MNYYQLTNAMFRNEGFKDPRTRFSEWLLEKGEPFFTYLKDEFGIVLGTVVGTPVLILLIISITKDLRKGKKPIAEIMAFFAIVIAIVFGQITHSP